MYSTIFGGIMENIDVEKLTFLDGVLVTKYIFEKILLEHLTDKNGNSLKGFDDDHFYSYLGIISDEVTEMLEDTVLNNGYFKKHGASLYWEFNKLANVE